MHNLCGNRDVSKQKFEPVTRLVCQTRRANRKISGVPAHSVATPPRANPPVPGAPLEVATRLPERVEEIVSLVRRDRAASPSEEAAQDVDEGGRSQRSCVLHIGITKSAGELKNSTWAPQKEEHFHAGECVLHPLPDVDALCRDARRSHTHTHASSLVERLCSPLTQRDTTQRSGGPISSFAVHKLRAPPPARPPDEHH